MINKILLAVCLALLLGAAIPVCATPFFARNYGLSCQTCHSGFPRLNQFGLDFKANNFRIPGAEKGAPLAWQHTVPFTAQVAPFYERLSPGAHVTQFTDTQLLAGGLLTPTTAFYLHHSYFIDTTPTEFPSYELWVQQVLDEKNKTFIKAGQFELPFAYSPLINRITPSTPLLFGTLLEGNDVPLGGAMSGLQLSVGRLDGTRAYLAYGAPAAGGNGTTNNENYFWGRFRDLFLRVTQGSSDRQVGIFGYFTNPPRDPSNPNSFERGQRYGAEGTLLLRAVNLQAMAVYGENSDPLGNGKPGFFRSAFVEADRMLLPWLGVSGRWDIQSLYLSTGKTYSDAKTAALCLYPYRSIKLSAEYQQLDHARSATTLSAAVTF
jgi:hypothetical protein